MDLPGNMALALDAAVHRLRREQPQYSAFTPVTAAQRYGLVGGLGVFLAIVAAAPWLAYDAALTALAVPFAFVAFVRVAAIRQLLRTGRATGPFVETQRDDLPRYSLLIPVYREARVVSDLIGALRRLEYPRAKLEVLFITEEDDCETRNALYAAGLDDNMRVLPVPDGVPRTKPRALNFGLAHASGDLVAIFDAEDVPDREQLLAAAAAFRDGGPDLACVQARLNIYNPCRNFFTKQFTLEYSALFDAILPALQSLGWPIPLGGTSNHFSRAILEKVGAWDPYNVTEDADLGTRLARAGYRTAMLSSTTWEEAPSVPRTWFAQRTRWIKGWMQTYLVHMRSPVQLFRDYGAWRFLGFQVVFGGLILAALVHPLMLLAAARQLYAGRLLDLPETGGHAWLWWISAFNLVACYVSAALLAALAVARRGGFSLIGTALGIPLYWLAISAAAYKALFEFVRRPHFWAKTEHLGDGRDNPIFASQGT